MRVSDAGIDKKLLIYVRDATLGDLNFVYATWLKGLRYGNEWFKAIDQTAYFKHYHQVLEDILGRPTTTIKVACLVDDPSVVIGYSVFEGSVLHWVFCKKAWRNIGLAKDLMPPKVLTVTHVTQVGLSILKKAPSVSFNPFIEQ